MDASSSYDRSAITILVVEDSPTQAAQLRMVLEAEQFTVLMAENGRAALAVLRETLPTMVITDVVMPEMDGYQLCDTIKKDPALHDIPVIMMTSLVSWDDITRSLECGATHFLRKPYDPVALISRINYILLNLELRHGRKVQMGLEIILAGKKVFVNSDRQQILDMLISTYDEALRLNEELQQQQAAIAQSNRILRSLYALAGSLSNAATPGDACQIALQGMTELLGYRAAWVLLPDDKAGLQTLCSKSLLPMPPRSEVCLGASMLLPDGRNAPVHIADCTCLRGTGEAALPRPHVIAPLSTAQGMAGVINALPRHDAVFDGEDLKVIGMVARQLSEALERLQLIESLNQRAVQLEEANKELESFSYSVSHDLRAPLRAIEGFSQLLQRHLGGGLDAEAWRLLTVIREGSMKMDGLIISLMELSRVGKVPLRVRQVDMTQLAQGVWLELQSDNRDHEVVYQMASLPPALGDPVLLRQVWANLLSNALKYSRGRPRQVIEVAGRLDGALAVYSVRDNGAGFNMAYYDKLFGVFQRLHGEQEFPGTGIGLANVKRIVTRHGGEVWAEGKEGEGAVFYFSLPLAAHEG